MFKLVAYSRLSDGLKQVLDQSCDVTVFNGITKENERAFKEALQNAEGLLGAGLPITESLLKHAPRLRYVGNVSAGYDNFDLEAMSAHGVMAVNAPNALTDTTADLIFGLVLSSARRITELDRFVRAKKWQTGIKADRFGVNVHHKTIGIIGMGRIGRAVAQRAARGFDMEVLYTKRHRDVKAEQELGITYKSLTELLQTSDFVCITLPLTAETHHFIDDKELKMMKPSAILVNGGRGPIINEQALIRALQDKTILGAGLDVYEQEPLSLDSPLLQLDNVVLAPHIGSATEETRTKMAEEAVHNLLQFINGEQPNNLLNP
ncbi:glyoxylate/hydroxypyruvate reductase B [Pullulanibacillus camelliae]|uniref:Glyoxylate/hydroxypyruvate reductase B n=1 Tax=Pullulanibacillus camelliae TaxID=1707096 RepID=A0A8J2VHX9_9BACL|nr:D-glycerate dehydrogenase [Pullulanibacillus camelliae]GGE26795.1 glyoxylate/hydroxypyruvate reductase B [Pullulanibacillus camelliae]